MAKGREREKHKCSEQMERRRHSNENMSCWHEDRRKQGERWAEGKEKGQGKKMATGTGREEPKTEAVAAKQEFMGSLV